MRAEAANLVRGVVGAWRFELQPSCAQGRRATRLRYAPANPVVGVAMFRQALDSMRVIHPAAEEKQLAMEKFEKFRAEGIINAAGALRSHGVPTKVTTVEQVQ
jgi:hypothetical protein